MPSPHTVPNEHFKFLREILDVMRLSSFNQFLFFIDKILIEDFILYSINGID